MDLDDQFSESEVTQYCKLMLKDAILCCKAEDNDALSTTLWKLEYVQGVMNYIRDRAGSPLLISELEIYYKKAQELIEKTHLGQVAKKIKRLF